MPWGEMSSPAPNDRTRLPLESNFRIDGSVEDAQLFAPHRSATQMLEPSRSISTALVEPQLRPSGSFAHPSTVRYGLGRSLTGRSLLCASAPIPIVAIGTRATTRAAGTKRRVDSITANLTARPHHALVLACDRRKPFVNELLNALPLVGLRRVDVALRVRGDAVHGEELPRLAAAVAEACQDLERLAVHDVHLLVSAVGEVDVLLLRIARERDVPHRSVAAGERRDALFLHELAVLAEHLDPVVRPVADVHEAVGRRLGTVDGISKLWSKRSVGIIRSHVGVLWRLSVRPPEALDRAGARVDAGHPLVSAAVVDERLVGLGVERDLCDAAEVIGRAAVHRLLRRSDLHQELALVRELEDVRVGSPVSADPDVVLVVDRDSVIRLRPLVPLPGAAPRLHQVALRIELEDRRRGGAAFAERRFGGGARLGSLVERRVATMDDEHVVA